MYHDARRIDPVPPRRVMLIGSPGAGKSELAQVIAGRLRLPFFPLERYFWRPGWERPSVEDWTAEVQELASRDEWVMSGTFPATLDLRVCRADWLVYIDAPMPVCFFRALSKMLRPPSGKEDEMAPGCPRRFDGALLRRIWNFPADVAPRISALIARERRNRIIFILRSRRDIDDFLNKVPVRGGLG